MLFEPMTTTAKTFLQDQIKTTLLIYEPRIKLSSVEIDTTEQYNGVVSIVIDYQVRATNSRYNMVYPFYINDGNELAGSFEVSIK